MPVNRLGVWDENGKGQIHHGEGDYALGYSQFRGGVGPHQKAGAGPTVPT